MKLLYRYPFAWPLISLIIGINLYYILFPISILYLGILMSIQCIVAVTLHRLRLMHSGMSMGRTLIIYSIFTTLGTMMCHLTDIRNDPHYYGDKIDQATHYIARVTDEPSIKQKITIYQIAIKAMHINGKWHKANGNIILNIYNNDAMPALQIYDHIVLPNKMRVLKHSGNPYAFDFKSYHNNKGIYHNQFSDYRDIVSVVKSKEGIGIIQKSKKRIQDIIRQNVQDTTTANLLQAILINEREGLDNNIWQTYSKTGIVHIIAISGMHIGIFFSMVYLLLFWIKDKEKEWIKVVIALPLIWTYIAMTGFPPSAVRAGVMISILMIGILVQRQHVPINTLLATAFTLLMMFPSWLFDLGFQLSFVSVLSILVYYPQIRLWYQPQSKLVKPLWNVVAVSISVQPLIFPIILYYFYQFPVLGVVANIPASLYSIIFMAGGVLLIIFGSIGIPVIWIGDMLAWTTYYFNKIISFIGDISPEIFYRLYIDKAIFWVILLLIISISLYIYQRKKTYWISSMGIILIICSYQSYGLFQRQHQEKVIVYNVYGKTLLSHISGSKSTIISQDSILEKDYKMTLKPSMIGHSITTIDTIHNLSPSRMMLVGSKSVLYINDIIGNNIKYKKTNVDYLILNSNSIKSLDKINELISYHKLIVDGSMKNYEIDRLMIDESKYADIHFVVRDGAFIID